MATIFVFTALRPYNFRTPELRQPQRAAPTTSAFPNFRTSELPNFRTFALSHFRTFALSHFRTFALSHFRTFELSNFRTFELSHFRTFALSHFRTFALSNFRTPNLKSPFLKGFAFKFHNRIKEIINYSSSTGLNLSSQHHPWC